MTGAVTADTGRASMLERWSALSPAVHRALIGSATVLGCLIVWELVVGAGLVSPLYASSPSRIALAGRELFRSGEIWNDLRVSATEFLFGYLLAAAVGIPLGLSIGLYRRVNYLLGPFVDVLNAVPRVTFLPILILWFGIGIWSKLAVVFLGAVIPITIATTTGVRTNEARFIRVAKSFGASQLKLISSIILPGTIPFIFTGLKYGAGRALLGVVVGELYASTAGVGHMIAEAGNTFDVDTVFFGVLLFTAAGLVMTALLNSIERSFDRWRPEGQVR
jgi:ABC-type nitrate/sulfonate/bicarbonate transport system permease component